MSSYITPLPPKIVQDLPAIVEEALYASANTIIDNLLIELSNRSMVHGDIHQDEIVEKLSSAFACGLLSSDVAHGLALDVNDVHLHIKIDIQGATEAAAATAARRAEELNTARQLRALAEPAVA